MRFRSNEFTKRICFCVCAAWWWIVHENMNAFVWAVVQLEEVATNKFIYLEINLTEKHQHERVRKKLEISNNIWTSAKQPKKTCSSSSLRALHIRAAMLYDDKAICLSANEFSRTHAFKIGIRARCRKTHQKSFAYAISHARRCLCIKYMYIYSNLSDKYI